MKWFKHISDSLDDPFIFELIEDFGPLGYLVFFGTLEVYAREFKPEENWVLRCSLKLFCQKFQQKQSKKVQKILKRLDSAGKFSVKISDNKVEVFIPKFKKFLDESTLKKVRAFRKDSGTPPEIFLPKDKEEDEDKERTKRIADSAESAEPFLLTKKKRKLKGKRLESFNLFWDAFGFKKGKTAAADSWLDIPLLTNSLVDTILSAARAEAAGRNGEKSPKWAQGWITERRWEDEDLITVTESGPPVMTDEDRRALNA